MPIAVFKSVRELSSEDSVHVAANLLHQQPGKKWKTKSPGDKSAYVILELEEEQQITGIDIGNEHSAFIEVLVGKSGCAAVDFKEILITCSFMTPIESKNSSNINRVRCFGQDALVDMVVPTKWRMIKVICTQPFNKHVQFGLSFIKVHVVDGAPKKEQTQKCLVPDKFLHRKTMTDSNEAGHNSMKLSFGLTKLMMREDSPDSESESAAGLFSRWKMSRHKGRDTDVSTGASIREASSPAALRRLSANSDKLKQMIMVPKGSVQRESCVDETKQILERNRDDLLFGNKDEEDPKIQADKERLRIEKGKQRKDNDNDKSKSQKTSELKTSHSRENVCKPSSTIALKPNYAFVENSNDITTAERAKKRFSSPSSRPAKKMKSSNNMQFRPFNKLLNGVVLVISGIQNPDRADLRNKALSMGAKYKGDWEIGCTHLICAFKNTPKYNQVKGKGKIVTRSWIEKCYSTRKYLPWRRFALVSAELDKPESDEEIIDESEKPDSNAPTSLHTKKISSQDDNNCTLAMYDLEEDNADATKEEKSSNQIYDVNSASDTDDEIEKAKENLRNNSGKHGSPKNHDIYEVSTEEEEFLCHKFKNSSSMQRFLKGMEFFICEDISAVNRIKLEKHIEQFGGTVTESLSDARYALSYKALNESDQATFSGETVNPLWIFEISDMEAYAPSKRYLISY